MSVAVENQGTKIRLIDGTDHEIQYSGVFVVCDTCATEYSAIPDWGYCDETYACAVADGDSLIILPGYQG